jgi:hypothetical protein
MKGRPVVRVGDKAYGENKKEKEKKEYYRYFCFPPALFYKKYLIIKEARARKKLLFVRVVAKAVFG